MRRQFNENGFLQRLEDGELSALPIKDRELETPPAGMPPGTRSQTVVYLDRSGTRVAIVHQYLLPDGKLGASGQPDPKYVLVRGQIFAWDGTN